MTPSSEILHTKTNPYTHITYELERFGRNYYVRTITDPEHVKEMPYSDYGRAKNHWDTLT